MDRSELKERLHEVDSLLSRGERSLAFQSRMVATLLRGGHDVTAAKLFLSRLESQQARHAANRDRLLKQFVCTTD